MGRPSDYSPELVAVICARMAEGVSLRSICLADDMPDKATVFRWLAAHKEFRDQYARAREARADAMAEEILEISDDDSDDAITDPETGATRINAEFVARSRLKVDTRKWLMARMAPKVYGDKVTQELQGPDGGAIKTISKIELVAAPFPAGMGEE
ncbi:hypothetical protein [Bradyrhizobium retamae]|uniref:Terminase small subunit protein n=1 Tax=Bradyrhizobium retamae TaxID=1300035 RepID=A0A0R3MP21_9BRAD|nr:hypothetical protein CQ13_07620 [Bradyrhizobium retamae]